MSAIKAEHLDVYALVEKSNVIISVLLDRKTIMTCEYPISELAQDIVLSLGDPDGFITGEDAEEAYETIAALEAAADLINDHIKD